MYMFLATCIFIYPPLHHPQPPQCEVSIHTNIYILISFTIFFLQNCTTLTPIPNIKECGQYTQYRPHHFLELMVVIFCLRNFLDWVVPSFGSYLAKGPPVNDKGVLSTATVLLHIAWGTKKWMLKKIKTQCI